MSELQTLAASDSGWPRWATPWSRGRLQIQSATAAFLAAGPGEMVSDTLEIGGCGDLAYRIGTYSLGRPAPDRATTSRCNSGTSTLSNPPISNSARAAAARRELSRRLFCDGGLRQQFHSGTFLDGCTVPLGRQP